MPHATTQTRVPAARLPQPAYEGLFQEPVYPDGLVLLEDDMDDDGEA